MNRHISAISLAALLGSLSFSAHSALSSSALLTFDVGVQTCNTSSTICSYQGSYFAVDTDADGMFSGLEAIGISSGSDGGLLVGQTQLAANSHQGNVDGTEYAPLDAAWNFFGNAGMHQTTSPTNILTDDGLGNVTLDFSGFGVLWNGIDTITLGGSDTFASDTGIAIVTCGIDCSVGDTYTLDYSAHVPMGEPAGFGGVFWSIHLEGTVSAVPVPAAVWLFGSGLVFLAGMAKRRK